MCISSLRNSWWVWRLPVRCTATECHSRSYKWKSALKRIRYWYLSAVERSVRVWIEMAELSCEVFNSRPYRRNSWEFEIGNISDGNDTTLLLRASLLKWKKCNYSLTVKTFKLRYNDCGTIIFTNINMVLCLTLFDGKQPWSLS